MATARMMLLRLWELYSRDIIFFGGLIALAVCFAVSTTLVVIVGYAFSVLCVLMVWEQDRAPFNHFDSTWFHAVLVVLAPLTMIGIVIGSLIWVLFLPIFWWRGIQKDRQERLEKYGERLSPSRLRNWLIGVPIYYACLAGVLFGMWALVNSS